MDASQETFDSIVGAASSPNDVFENFFDWYQDVWIYNDDLVSALDNMPRPLREVAVAHQAFGYMSCEAPSGYYLRFERLFDDEIRRGLERLGFAECYVALSEGRAKLEAAVDGELSLDEDGEIYEQLPSLEQIEDRIGRWLLTSARN